MGWALWGILLLLAAGAALLIRQVNRLDSGEQTGMVGLTGEAQETFTASGMVLVRGELWRATASKGIVQKGDRVRVLSAGPELTLVVEKVDGA
jgi:membrane-bound ClpP family serine protease